MLTLTWVLKDEKTLGCLCASTDVGEEIQDLESRFLTDLSTDQEKVACRTLTASLALLFKKKKSKLFSRFFFPQNRADLQRWKEEEILKITFPN